MTEQRRAVLNGLVAGPLTLRDIAERANSSPDGVRRVLRKLEDDRCVSVVGKRGKKLVYSLTKRGATAIDAKGANISLPTNVQADLSRGRSPRIVPKALETALIQVLESSMAEIRKTEDLANALGRSFDWLTQAFRNSYGIRCGTWILACKLSKVDWLIHRGVKLDDAATTVGLNMRTIENCLSGSLRFRGQTVPSWRLVCPAVHPDSKWMPRLPARDPLTVAPCLSTDSGQG
ncbi:hypothetical protein GCM10027191_24600 [Novilysobacter erysipheiresistens]